MRPLVVAVVSRLTWAVRAGSVWSVATYVSGLCPMMMPGSMRVAWICPAALASRVSMRLPSRVKSTLPFGV